MTGRAPFSMVPHGDVLARMADLEGDEIALFMVAYFLMLERRGPIPDDMAWLGRRAGVSTRRANQIRLKLLDQGKWQLRADQLGDPAALAIVERQNRRSEVNRSNALERWQSAGQPELDFTTKPAKKTGKRQKTANTDNAIASEPARPGGEMRNGGKNGEKSEINQRTNGFKDDLIGAETAENRQSTPGICIADSCARATPELEVDTIQTTESESRAIDRPDALPRILEAAGLRPSTPDHLATARAMVEAWAADGIDLDRIVLPTIRRMVADSADPTSSLKRFDRTVRYEHAREGGKAATSATPSAQATPTPRDGPDPRLAQLRDRLRSECGARTYDGWLRPCRLDLDPTTGALIVEAPSQFMADWVQTHFAERLRSLARSLGIPSINVGFAPSSAPP